MIGEPRIPDPSDGTAPTWAGRSDASRRAVRRRIVLCLPPLVACIVLSLMLFGPGSVANEGSQLLDVLFISSAAVFAVACVWLMLEVVAPHDA